MINHLLQAIGKRLVTDRQPIKTSDRKREILAYIEEKTKATTADIADFLGLSKVYVRRILREMVNDGTIEKVGSNRDAYYMLNDGKTTDGDWHAIKER